MNPGLGLSAQAGIPPPPTENVVGVRWRLKGMITGLDPGAEVLPAHPAGDGFKASVKNRTLTLRDLEGDGGLVYRKS